MFALKNKRGLSGVRNPEIPRRRVFLNFAAVCPTKFAAGTWVLAIERTPGGGQKLC
jgi:hypothetical protein